MLPLRIHLSGSGTEISWGNFAAIRRYFSCICLYIICTVYIYIYMYIYIIMYIYIMYIWIHIYIYIYMYTCIHVCMYIHIHIYIYILIYIIICTYSNIFGTCSGKTCKRIGLHGKCLSWEGEDGGKGSTYLHFQPTNCGTWTFGLICIHFLSTENEVTN